MTELLHLPQELTAAPFDAALDIAARMVAEMPSDSPLKAQLQSALSRILVEKANPHIYDTNFNQ